MQRLQCPTVRHCEEGERGRGGGGALVRGWVDHLTFEGGGGWKIFSELTEKGGA